MIPQQLRDALVTTLKNNPMYASFFVWDKEALESNGSLHVTMKPTKKLFDQVIEDGGVLKTLDDLKALALKYPQPRHATFPGPMFRALIYHVEEINSSAVLFNGIFNLRTTFIM
jgi:hypothetical protein